MTPRTPLPGCDSTPCAHGLAGLRWRVGQPLASGGVNTPSASGAAPAGGEWLSTAEASSRLGITARTLYRFIDEGRIPAYRFGRVIRLREREVEEFIDLCRIEPGTLDHLYADSGSGTGSSSGAH